jgi:phasin family protein
MTTKPKAADQAAAAGDDVVPVKPGRKIVAGPLTTETPTVNPVSLAAPAVPAAVSPAAVTAPVQKGYTTMIKSAEQFAQFHQGNVEAFMKASQIWVTGLQDLSKHFVGTAQAAVEDSVSTFRSLTTVKSVKEAVELQTAYTRTAFEKAMSEGTKLTETSLKLAEEAAAPLTARMNAAVETFTVRA